MNKKIWTVQYMSTAEVWPHKYRAPAGWEVLPNNLNKETGLEDGYPSYAEE